MLVETLAKRCKHELVGRIWQKEVGVRKKKSFVLLCFREEPFCIETRQVSAENSRHLFGRRALRHADTHRLKSIAAERDYLRNCKDIFRLSKKIIARMHVSFVPGKTHDEFQG